jgi:hypothetical protein
VDISGRHPGAFAKVPGMPGGLRCDWNWSWAFGIKCDVPADAPFDPVRGITVIPDGKGPAPFHLAAMGIAPALTTTGYTLDINVGYSSGEFQGSPALLKMCASVLKFRL